MTARRSMLLGAAAVCAAGALAACSAETPAAPQGTTLRIAAVDNGDVLRMQELSRHFTADNPDVELDWVILDENTLRQRVATDVATGGGQFDVVALGTYEASIWAERDWLVPLDAMPGDYDLTDVIPSILESLSYDGRPYALPFYGESSFTMYRTDVFADAGLEMPRDPTWDDIKDAATVIDADHDVEHAMCLRGKPGWGENMALVTAMANSFGARWFDLDWHPQLDQPEWAQAVSEYVALGELAPPDAASNGYSENLALFRDGRCAIWVDATSAASFVTDPEVSEVADQVGFALAPDNGLGRESNWLWAWALAIPESSDQQEAAKEFIAWATSPQYTEIVAKEHGWLHAPPGTRTSLYENPAYLDAAPFAELTLESIEKSDPDDPTVGPVPYRGIQYVTIPEFQGIGTAVGNQVAEALAGTLGVEEALTNSQWVTEQVIRRAQFIE